MNEPYQTCIKYARENFRSFAKTNIKEIQQLLCAILYRTRLTSSPYASLITTFEWDDIRHIFCRDFCSLVGHGPDAPLETSVTVGTQALPTIYKMAQIKKIVSFFDVVATRTRMVSTWGNGNGNSIIRSNFSQSYW